MEISKRLYRSWSLLRFYPKLFQLQTVSKRILTNTNVNFNNRSHSTTSGEQNTLQYKHEHKVYTDGVIKTIISNCRDLYRELRDDFRANRGFNLILITAVGSYIFAFMGKLFLEYRKDKREEKKMERAYEIEIKQLGVKLSSDQQPASAIIPALVKKKDSKHDPSNDTS
ncbi:unnamed protein product [Rotaria magnacalcarata]|uniref:Uncharacterized protein n=1 Tax=Rotaria magnacalcarata TaxID=392030 RepID=A0A816K2C7_9BILA|nr:unnamed protein product [Rotaria magnacalcarata]CAF1210558.1 unnamed protein product [Rotaria magnacalcarata]CAF1904657.1 unnamed protein product [Rotaria magnacalcarata]CAF1929555.1 unnamed protein product [Rotaria magnacalcarata]CAF1955280.1 unnamed protein product [Rotaria magnacalcarata]